MNFKDLVELDKEVHAAGDRYFRAMIKQDAQALQEAKLEIDALSHRVTAAFAGRMISLALELEAFRLQMAPNLFVDQRMKGLYYKELPAMHPPNIGNQVKL